MPDRVVKTTLIIDDHGAVRVVKGVGEESARTEGRLSHLDRSAKGLGKTFSGLKGMLAGGLGLVGAGGLAFGLSSVITKTKEVAEETEKFHSITGLGAQSSLKYSQALRARGLQSDNLIKAFGYLAKNVHTAEIQEEKFGKAQVRAVSKGKELTTELGKQAKAIKELGLTAAGFAGKGPEEKIQAITKAFENLAAGEKKTRLERELFGRGGNQLSILLEKNSLSLNNTAAKVEKYFGTIKGGMHGQEELLEKQREAQLAWEGLQFQLGTKLTPVLIKVFEWFSKVTLEVEHGTGTWGRLAKTFEGVITFLKPLWQGFEKLVGPSNALGLALGGLAAMKASNFAGLSLGLAGIAKWAAPILVLAGAVHELDKVLPKGERPENLLGGHQPGEGLREGERGPGGGFKGFLHRWEHGPHAPLSPAGVEGGVAAGTGHSRVELHVDGHKLAEALLRNPRARREIAEASTIYAHGMAARGHG